MKFLYSAILSVSFLLAANSQSSADTIRFDLSTAEGSSFTIDGYFSLTGSGRNYTLTDVDITTGAGVFSGVFETDGFSYQSDDDLRFLSESQFTLINNEVTSIGDSDPLPPLELRFINFGFFTVGQALQTIADGGVYELTIGVVECFNCSPFREGLLNLTAGAPIEPPVEPPLGGAIPLPASGVLLLGALGAFSLRRKR